MRVLLDFVYYQSLQTARMRRGRYAVLHDVKVQFSHSNWFLVGDIDHKYLNINYSILISVLREKIQDEPFIDLVYKYLRMRYVKTLTQSTSLKIELIKESLLSYILFNIYMHPFDLFIKDVIIFKNTKGKKKRANLEFTKIRQVCFRVTVKKAITYIINERNFTILHYVRYFDNFLIGVLGSRKTCVRVASEIKYYLKKNLALTFNIKKSKINHSTIECVLFLKYGISCIFIKRFQIGYNAKSDLTRKTTKILFSIPLEGIVLQLRKKGFLNSKNLPTRNGKYINIDL